MNHTEKTMLFIQNRKIILASGSPRRKEYLERYGLKFEIIIPDILESPAKGEKPSDFAERMAEEKARNVSEQCSREKIVIAADTIVTLNDKIIGKPPSEDQTLPMLEELNGKTHEVITSYVVHDCSDKKNISKTSVTQVSFNKVSVDILKAYADCDEPLDKAGAYSIQDLGTLLIKSIRGSYNNVVGLPVELLLQDLLNSGYISVNPSS